MSKYATVTITTRETWYWGQYIQNTPLFRGTLTTVIITTKGSNKIMESAYALFNGYKTDLHSESFSYSLRI